LSNDQGHCNHLRHFRRCTGRNPHLRRDQTRHIPRRAQHHGQRAPEKIFPLINEFDRWGTWSPYEKRDPAMKRTRSGPPSGKGAVYGWEGNSQIGAGRMEIMEALPPSKIVIKLDFFKPFEAHNIAEFTLEGKGDTTNVTWAMHGPANYISKLMGVFINMDRMIGTDFEAGLSNLKAISEK